MYVDMYVYVCMPVGMHVCTCVGTCMHVYVHVMYVCVDPAGRAVYGVGLQPLDYWDLGFESR